MKTFEIGWSTSKRRGLVLDFLISGRSLLSEIERRQLDLVPRLGSGLQPTDILLRSLLLVDIAGDTKSGRVALYVCPECGDIGCGVVSVRITRNHSMISWSDFAKEDSGGCNIVPLERLGPFHFAKEQYGNAVAVKSIKQKTAGEL